ncbi:MAG: hypothetical protein ABI134_15245, partial [Byssovorax sp.]
HLVAQVHAVVAWIATAALLAALPWLIRPRRDRVTLAIGAVAALSVTLAGGLGVLLEAAYRARIRQRLFVQSPSLGWLFERKEHLAFAAIVLAWCALAAMAASRLAREPERAADLQKVARLAGITAAALALAASVMAAIVARRAHF